MLRCAHCVDERGLCHVAETVIAHRAHLAANTPLPSGHPQILCGNTRSGQSTTSPVSPARGDEGPWLLQARSDSQCGLQSPSIIDQWCSVLLCLIRNISDTHGLIMAPVSPPPLNTNTINATLSLIWYNAGYPLANRSGSRNPLTWLHFSTAVCPAIITSAFRRLSLREGR